ncbi:hypothetical protein Tco_0032878 [Tanacetum coccineum]
MNQVNEPMPQKFSPTGSGPSPRGKGHEGDSMPTSRFQKINQVNMPPKLSPTGSGPSPRGKGHEGDSMPTSRFQKINQVNEPMPPKFSPTGSGPSPRGKGHEGISRPFGNLPQGHSPCLSLQPYDFKNVINNCVDIWRLVEKSDITRDVEREKGGISTDTKISNKAEGSPLVKISAYW